MKIREKKTTDITDIYKIMKDIYELVQKNNYDGTLFISALLSLTAQIHAQNKIPPEMFEQEIKRLVHDYGERFFNSYDENFEKENGKTDCTELNDLSQDLDTATAALQEIMYSKKFENIQPAAWPLALITLLASGFVGKVSYEEFYTQMDKFLKKAKPLFDQSSIPGKND